MAAVTAAVIGATVGAASLANSIEQANQQRRLAGQAANGAKQDADRAMQEQSINDANAQAQKMANAARANQRSRVPGVGGQVPTGQPQTAPPPSVPTLMSAQPAASPGNGTLLGQ